jgi:hypothetical protein
MTRIAKGPRRTDLELSKANPALKQYVTDIERELERTQLRNHRLRKNIRSMQTKLEMANLKAAFASYSKNPPLTVVNSSALTEDDVKRIVGAELGAKLGANAKRARGARVMGL